MRDIEKAVFLDRDGTINEEVHYLYKPEDLSLIPEVPQAVKELNDAGFKVIVVSNQAGVARGYYSESDVDHLHDVLNERLRQYGAHIDLFFYCPHHPEHGIGMYKTLCRCRKPGIGLFEMAEKYFAIDKSRSYMIGDKLIDTQAGHNYGIKSILVGSGYGREMRQSAETVMSPYDFFADTLMEAVCWIQADQRKG